MAEQIYHPGTLDDVVTQLSAGNRNLSELINAINDRNGFVIGTNVEAWSAILDALAGLSPAANQFPYFTGAASMTLANSTTFGRSLLNEASAASTVTDLGLDNTKVASISFVIDGGGAAITTGVKGYLQIPFGCTITQATQLADQSGSIVTNIWKCTYSQFDAGSTHPVSSDKITSSTPPTISTTYKSTDSTLTSWTTSISAGDILAFNVDSITTIQRNTLTLWVTKT